MARNVIIIGGCPRSGTGALASLLTKDGRAIVTQENGLGAWKAVFEKKSDVSKEKVVYTGDKMPEGYLNNAGSLYIQFPDAKFLFTNRNGYAVIASYARRPLRKRKPEDISEESLINTIKFGEKVWLRNYKKLKTMSNVLPKDKYIYLKYEDNCSDITGMLAKVGSFLGYDTPVGNDNAKPYRPIHLDWVVGIEFWEDIIKTTVSNEFRNLVSEYDGGKNV